ncbi:MAG TPA: amidohydrolase family protein [Gemmatimonadales bacterium]|nr:amidohydrolase family protein [Gemmatimonadales bacterium]
MKRRADGRTGRRAVTARLAMLSLALLSVGPSARLPVLHAQDSAIVIRAGRLFDSEKGVFLANQQILVRGRNIAEVGASVSAPAGARVIDLSGKTVLPGLIDAHTHLLNLEHPKGNISTEGVKQVVIEGLPLRALHGAARGRTFLDAGITTVRDLGNSGLFGDVALRQAIDDGSVPGPRMIVSGPGLSPIGGQFPGLLREHQELAGEEYRIVHNPDDAADAVRENVTLGARVIKIYSNNTPNPGSFSDAELAAIVESAKRHHVRVAAHATSDEAVYRAAKAGVNSIEHAYQVTDSTLALMAKNGVFLVPTDLDTVSVEWYLKQSGNYTDERFKNFVGSLQYNQDRLRRAIKAGVTIAAGSDNYIDMGVPQGQAAKHNLLAYLYTGMTPVQVLQAATINDAKLLGMEGKIGVIKQGAFADIIAIDGDPETDFKSIEKVTFVMKEGTVYSLRSTVDRKP